MKIDKCGFIVGAMMLTSLGFQSCQEEDIPLSDTRYPILFRSVDTRAVAGIDSLKDNGFKVYAHIQGNTGKDDNYATFNKEVLYTKNNGKGVWEYKNLEYWIPNAKYWFKAFYPKDYAFIINNKTTDQNYTISDYQVTSQVDLMVASAQRKVDSNASSLTEGSVVNLSFNHLLACVEVKIKSAISGVTINSVVINDVSNFGNYNSETGVWTATNQASITKQSGVSLELNKDAVDVTNGGILVIPYMTGKETITIVANNKRYENITLPLNTSWQAGHKYTYTAEIKQNDIIFNEPDVATWDSDSATGSVVIK